MLSSQFLSSRLLPIRFSTLASNQIFNLRVCFRDLQVTRQIFIVLLSNRSSFSVCNLRFLLCFCCWFWWISHVQLAFKRFFRFAIFYCWYIIDLRSWFVRKFSISLFVSVSVRSFPFSSLLLSFFFSLRNLKPDFTSFSCFIFDLHSKNMLLIDLCAFIFFFSEFEWF